METSADSVCIQSTVYVIHLILVLNVFQLALISILKHIPPQMKMELCST